MADQRMEEGEEDALFHSSYPCAVYYVQSPSTASHANSSDVGRNTTTAESAAAAAAASLSSPSCFRPHHYYDNLLNRSSQLQLLGAASRFTLSRYSSSRGSSNNSCSFLHEKKTVYDRRSRDADVGDPRRVRLGVVVGDEEEEEEEDTEEGSAAAAGFLWRFLSLDPSSSSCCISFQIAWRFLVSLGVALLVFFLATKPPSPKISIKAIGIRQFDLGEGLDSTGVVTNVLTCNCSMDLEIDNQSKVFGLHVRPPSMEMAFGRLEISESQGSQEAYVNSDSSSILRLYVGTTHRPVYGAGRSMQDLLDSGRGLPLVIRLRTRSSFRVVGSLIRWPKFHHHADCLLILVLDGSGHNNKHTHTHKTTCSATTSHA